MMNRLTISLDEELEEFLDEKSKEYGNRSKVVREALHQMKKSKMVEDMRQYFSKESGTDDGVEDEQIGVWSDLPDYK